MASKPILVPALVMFVVLAVGACGGKENDGAGNGSVDSAGVGAGAATGAVNGNASANNGGPGTEATGGRSPAIGTGGVGTAGVGVMAGSGGSAGNAATGSGGTESGSIVCQQSLSMSGCAPTYDDAVASVRCDPAHAFGGTLVNTCGTRRLFSPGLLGAAQTCVYDEKGALVGSRTCSKPVGGCNCFVAGEADLDGCTGDGTKDLCATDAGIDTD